MLEIYGLPIRLGKYPPGTPDEEKVTLLRAVTGLGHAAAGIIPESMSIEFQEASKGSAEPFMAMMRWCDDSMSKAILGGTLTSQTSESGGGAYALGQVHNEVRHDLLAADARQLAATLSRDLLWPLLVLNRSGNLDARRAPAWCSTSRTGPTWPPWQRHYRPWSSWASRFRSTGSRSNWESRCRPRARQSWSIRPAQASPN